MKVGTSTHFRKIMALALMSATFISTIGTASVVDTYADETTDVSVSPTGTADQEVEAYFNVTKSDLNDMGYDLVVTVPLSFGLKFDKITRAYSGSANVSANGIVADGKSVSVKVDKTHEKYGQIYKENLMNNLTSDDTTGFACSLSKQSWTANMCYTNLQDRIASREQTHTGTLNVTVPFRSFRLGELGKYYTVVPLVISLADGE